MSTGFITHANGVTPPDASASADVAQPKRLVLYKISAWWWRWITLLQIPLILVAATSASVFFLRAKTIVEVKPELTSGRYRLEELGDKEFIDFARNIASYVGTFSPFMAQIQYAQARDLLDPGYRETFDANATEFLQMVKDNRRTQIFLADDDKVRVERIVNPVNNEQREVVVYIPGTRKLANGARASEDRLLSLVSDGPATLYVKMVISPRSTKHKYGIVANDVRFLEGLPK